MPTVNPPRSLLLLCLLACAATTAATASAQVAELRPGEMLRFAHPAGTVLDLAFDVEADQFVHLDLLQAQVDVAATVTDPTGAVVAEAALADSAGLIKPISWTRSKPGRHLLRLRVDKATDAGYFEVLLDRLRPSADSDDEWLRCEREFVEVMRVVPTDVASRKAGADRLRRLVEDWRALGDERWAALTQVMLGAVYFEGDPERGLEDCLEAADYAERSGDPAAEWAFSCTSTHLAALGHVDEALQVDADSLAREKAAGDSSDVRYAQLNLGLRLLTVGRMSEAATLLAEVVEDAEEAGDLVVQAYGHAHLGRLHRDRGEYQQALDEYTRSLAHPFPNSAPAAGNRAALASVQLAVGDVAAALASAQLAVAEARRLSNDRFESVAVLTLGRVRVERGEIDEAIALLSYNVALCRRKNMVLSEVEGLVELGRAEAAASRRSVARRHQQEALALSRTHRYVLGEVQALAALCALDDAEGSPGTACEDALSKAQPIGYGPVALLSRYYLARAARRGGAPEVARAHLEDALKAVDAQRLGLRRADLRQTFSATVDDIEDEYVDLLVDLAAADPAGGWDVRAFEASERARGRSLRDELADSRLGIRQGADPSLLQEEDALRDRLRAALVRQQRGGVPAAAAQELEQTIGGLQAGLADVAARLRLASPRYAALSQPEPLGLDAIRAALLADDSVLLYYALGERRSFLWVVTRTSLERHLLPSRAEIEPLARRVVAASSSARPGSLRDLASLGRVLLTPAARRLDGVARPGRRRRSAPSRPLRRAAEPARARTAAGGVRGGASALGVGRRPAGARPPAHGSERRGRLRGSGLSRGRRPRAGPVSRGLARQDGLAPARADERRSSRAPALHPPGGPRHSGARGPRRSRGAGFRRHPRSRTGRAPVVLPLRPLRDARALERFPARAVRHRAVAGRQRRPPSERLPDLARHLQPAPRRGPRGPLRLPHGARQGRARRGHRGPHARLHVRRRARRAGEPVAGGRPGHVRAHARVLRGLAGAATAVAAGGLARGAGARAEPACLVVALLLGRVPAAGRVEVIRRRTRTWLPCCLSSACVLWAASASAQVMELRPGEPRWFESKTGNVAEFAFDVGADQFVHLELHQWEADVAATVLDPRGAIVQQADVGEATLIETISWTRWPPGRFTLRVRVKSAYADGRFTVLLDRPRPSADTDERWLRCERAFTAMQREPVSQLQRKATMIGLRRLLADWRALGDERWAALTQALLGATYWDGDFERGLDDCLEAAEYADRSGDRTAELGFNCAASHLTSLGYLEEANQMAREVIARFEQAGQRAAVRIGRLNLSRQLLVAGQTAEAASHLAGVLQEAEATGDPTAQAYAHAHLGRLYRDRGEYQQSLDHYARSLAIPHAHPNPTHRAALASAQIAVGDLTAALASARRALTDVRRAGADARAESAALQVLGRVHLERGEVDQAIALLSSDVALCRRRGMVLSEVDALVALGRAEAARGRRSVARRHQQDALVRSRAQSYPVGEALALAALCALDDGEGVSGESCAASLDKALAIGHGPVALLSRYYLARAARRAGDLEVARAQLEETLKVVSAQRLGLRRADLRQTFSATVDDIEDEYVDLLVELAQKDPAGAWNERAFEASERARGRSLRDALAESRVGIRQGADPVLLQEEDALRDRLRAALARQLKGGISTAAAGELERTIGGLQADLEDVAARIRVNSPRYAALSQPEPPSLDAVRAALVDDDSALLYYALGDQRSFLWVVTRTSLERHELPPRRQVERLARRAIASSSAVRGSRRDLVSLGRMILAPAASHLHVSRVVIVPDGVLHYVPFAALPASLTSGPLLEQADVLHVPSAAAGVLLARVPARVGPSAVAVFADPVFRADDERVDARMPTRPLVEMASLPRELTRSGRLARLPFTRREALAIQEHAGASAQIALDFEANRAAALDERMASYRIVHFATHGLLNASRPELSGVVLSLVDRDGRPQDGFLTSLDTFNLRLDADLVVLSGCRTGLGRDVRGEGIVGLTRGFMYAGARGVLASLWPVDDAATAELMRAFYAGLLGPRRLSPPAALRAAQRHVRSDPRWRAPYYWAAFQLQGVWPSDPRH